MFESLRNWIEVLFQGITRENATGHRYIARTPTIWDIWPTGGLSVKDSGYAAAAYYELKVPSGDWWILQGATIRNNNRPARGSAYIRDKENKLYTFHTADSKGTALYANAIPETSSPILLPPGTTIGVQDTAFQAGDQTQVNLLLFRIPGDMI